MRNAMTAFVIARLDEDEHEATYVLHQGAAQIAQNHIPLLDAARRIAARHLPDASGRCRHDGRVWPCPDLYDLAGAWCDHPDYRRDWSTEP